MLSESLSKKPSTPRSTKPNPKGQTQHHTTSTGQNKLIRRLIKHTVEFSKIRRTRSSPAGPVRSRGNLQKLTGRSTRRQTRGLRASVGRARFPLQLTFWPGGGATCGDEKNCRPSLRGVTNRGSPDEKPQV